MITSAVLILAAGTIFLCPVSFFYEMVPPKWLFGGIPSNTPAAGGIP